MAICQSATNLSRVRAPMNPPQSDLTQLRGEVEDTVVNLIEDLRRAIIVVEQFKGPESQAALFHKINADIIPKFNQVATRSKGAYTDEVPYQLLRIIDEGKNPDLYTQGLLEDCVRRNERSKGKFEALQKLSDQLHIEAKREFPEQYAAYLAMKQNAPQQ